MGGVTAVDSDLDEGPTRRGESMPSPGPGGPVHRGVDVEVLIVGAGLSGIGAACRLRERLPHKRIAILEGRERLGGTWDLFRYPGIRSDSDLYTLSYPFRPWTEPGALASGEAILRYLRETAEEATISDDIRYGQHVTRAAWDGDTGTWSVTAQSPEGTVRHTCRFLYLATGYYRYDSGHAVTFPGQEAFTGPVIHPQHWPEDLDLAGRRIVVIGSGATAVSLVPALADRGARVTMLQRSPSYLVSLPGVDHVAQSLRRRLPERAAYRLTRAKHVATNVASYELIRRFPHAARRLLMAGVRRRLPEGFDVATHFGPSYDPWDERLCVVPDGDLFRAVSSGRAEVATDTVDRFTAEGITLTSGRTLDADIVVTATGLALEVAGGIDLSVDGRPVRMSEEHVYKGLMLSDVPNLAWCVGYTNNSWTLRADLAAIYVCRLLAHLDHRGLTTATPRFDAVGVSERPLLDLTSGYVRRAEAILPKQGERAPWRMRQNYLRDLVTMRAGRIDDGRLELGRAGRRGRRTPGDGVDAPAGATTSATGPEAG